MYIIRTESTKTSKKLLWTSSRYIKANQPSSIVYFFITAWVIGDKNIYMYPYSGVTRFFPRQAVLIDCLYVVPLKVMHPRSYIFHIL